MRVYGVVHRWTLVRTSMLLIWHVHGTCQIERGKIVMASRRKSTFGSIRRLPSRRYQARFVGPDGQSHSAPVTFDTRMDAEVWLATVRADVVRGLWRPPTPEVEPITFSEYAQQWLTDRVLKPRTRHHYAAILTNRLLPTFGPLALEDITPAMVARWHTRMDSTRPTMRAHSYSLLRTILRSAVADQLIASSPCTLRGAGGSRRVHTPEPATLAELETIVAAMPEHLRLLVLLSAWCALRFGEVTELRRSDVDLRTGTLHVRRAVVRVDGEVVVGTPKSRAGHRDVAIPPHLLPAIKAHLREHATFGRDGLLFPSRTGGHLSPSTLYESFYKARIVAGRPDLRVHDLRHVGAVLAASTGATLAELMARLGHSTPTAAMLYQHASRNRDAEIAAALSVIAEQRHQ
jgi:integrase